VGGTGHAGPGLCVGPARGRAAMRSLLGCTGSHSTCSTSSPTVLVGIVLNFNWRRELLWELDLPVEDVPVTDLRWLLSMPVWSLDGEPFKVSPEQVRADPARHQAHYARALAADLSYPLHVLVRANEPDRVVTVLDGFHRLFKAVLTGQSMITVKKVPEHLLDMIACR
jgi:hypothetical protein